MLSLAHFSGCTLLEFLRFGTECSKTLQKYHLVRFGSTDRIRNLETSGRHTLFMPAANIRYIKEKFMLIFFLENAFETPLELK